MTEKERSARCRSKNPKKPGRRAFAALGAVLFIGLSSCAQMIPGLGKLEDATVAVYAMKNSASGSDGFDVFQAVVFPIIQQSKCTNCHTSQQPTFAATDMQVAYAAAKTRISLSSPDTSILIAKSQDGHCGGCTPAARSDWVSAIEQWAVAENAGASTGDSGGSPMPGPTVTSAPVDSGAPPVYVTPAQMLTGANFTDKSISLAGYNASLTGVSLLFNVQDPYAAVANSARISNLRLRNQSAGYVVVRGIRLFQSVDATIDPANPADYKSDIGAAFLDVDMVLEPNTTVLLSSAEAILPKGATDGLYYGFGFQTLATGCKSPATFSATVMPIMDNRCTSCHGSGGLGSGAWTMSSDPATRCVQALKRSDVVAPVGSMIIQYPYYNQGAHPPTSLQPADVDTFINWLTQER